MDAYNRKLAKKGVTSVTPQIPEQGDIAKDSLFAEEEQIQQKFVPGADLPFTHDGLTRNRNAMKRVLDPNPKARERWERRQVIQLVRRGGRLTREQALKQQEREHLSKSPTFKTSVKKLGMIARQIQGKTIDDAIVQMRFSKKKIAIEVMKQLEFARDEAVVMRGMGLGLRANALPAPEAAEPNSAIALAAAEAARVPARPVDIRLKDGSRRTVTNQSTIYIDQAWVGRGPYGRLPDYRARGRIFIMRTPWTSISVVLKEEVTRVRQFEEREAKSRKRRMERPWVAMPDRPIQIKKQWYSW